MSDLVTHARNTALAAFIGAWAFACSPASEGGRRPGTSEGGSGGSGSSATSGGTGGSVAQPSGGAGGSSTGGGGGAQATGGAQNGTGGANNATGGAQNGTGGQAVGGSGGGGGGFDAGADALRNRVQAGQVCDRLATIQCAGEAYCCDNPGRTFEQCKQAQLTACGEIYLDQISQDPLTAYSVDAAESAFSELETLASQCDPGIATWGMSPDGLRGIMLGTLAASASCAPTALQVTDYAKVAAYLASCTNPSTTACLPTGVPPLAPWTCAPRSQLNGACFSDLNCVDGLYCDNNLDNPNLDPHQCLQRKANGTTCTFANECVSLTCQGGQCVEATSQTAYCLAQ